MDIPRKAGLIYFSFVETETYFQMIFTLKEVVTLSNVFQIHFFQYKLLLQNEDYHLKFCFRPGNGRSSRRSQPDILSLRDQLIGLI